VAEGMIGRRKGWVWVRGKKKKCSGHASAVIKSCDRRVRRADTDRPRESAHNREAGNAPAASFTANSTSPPVGVLQPLDTDYYCILCYTIVCYYSPYIRTTILCYTYYFVLYNFVLLLLLVRVKTFFYSSTTALRYGLLLYFVLYYFVLLSATVSTCTVLKTFCATLCLEYEDTFVFFFLGIL
jgi:hypothetical protein